jgi:hypothetical protein
VDRAVTVPAEGYRGGGVGGLCTTVVHKAPPPGLRRALGRFSPPRPTPIYATASRGGKRPTPPTKPSDRAGPSGPQLRPDTRRGGRPADRRRHGPRSGSSGCARSRRPGSSMSSGRNSSATRSYRPSTDRGAPVRVRPGRLARRRPRERRGRPRPGTPRRCRCRGPAPGCGTGTASEPGGRSPETGGSCPRRRRRR